jgi:hypothetical protein
MGPGMYEAFLLYQDGDRKSTYEWIVLADSASHAVDVAKKVMAKKFSTVRVIEGCACLVEGDCLAVRKFGQTPAGYKRARSFCDAQNKAAAQ